MALAAPQFGNAVAIVARVKELCSSEDTLLTGLSELLKALQNRSTLVLEEYLKNNKSLKEVLRYLTWPRQKHTDDATIICFQVLEKILLYTATVSGPFHSAGSQLVHAVLQGHMRVVYGSLSAGSLDKLKTLALKLLTAMVAQDAVCAKDVLTAFDFGYKPLEHILVQSRASDKRKKYLQRAYVNFAMAFLVVGSAEVAQGILESKGFMSSVVKFVSQDGGVELQQTLYTILREKVVLATEIPKKTKSVFFTASVLLAIASPLLKECGTVEDGVKGPSDSKIVLADLCHRLLLDLCTNCHIGISYKPKWSQIREKRTNNPTLLSFIQSLSAHYADRRIRHLIITIVSGCPDLLVPFAKCLSFVPEPRLALKWITMVEFILEVYASMPSLREMFESFDASQEGPTCIGLLTGYCFPPFFTRNVLNSGVQNISAYVKYLTLSVIKCGLRRALELFECSGSSSASPLLSLFKDALLRQLPDVKTLISLHHNIVKKTISKQQPPAQGEIPPELALREKVLGEGRKVLLLVTETMRSYQSLSPSIFLQADYDVSKLLSNTDSLEGEGEGMDQLILQTLQLISGAPRGALRWHHQGSTTLKVLLNLMFKSSPTVSEMAADVLQRTLSEMFLLEDFPADVACMVRALRHHASLATFGETTGCVKYLSDVIVELATNTNFQTKIISKLGLNQASPAGRDGVVGLLAVALLKNLTSSREGIFVIGAVLLETLHMVDDVKGFAAIICERLEMLTFQDDRLHVYLFILYQYFCQWTTERNGAMSPPLVDIHYKQAKRSFKKKLKTESLEDIVDQFVPLMLMFTAEEMSSTILALYNACQKWALFAHITTVCPVLIDLNTFDTVSSILPLSTFLKVRILERHNTEPSPSEDQDTPPPKRRREKDTVASPLGAISSAQPKLLLYKDVELPEWDIVHSFCILRSLLVVHLWSPTSDLVLLLDFLKHLVQKCFRLSDAKYGHRVMFSFLRSIFCHSSVMELLSDPSKENDLACQKKSKHFTKGRFRGRHFILEELVRFVLFVGDLCPEWIQSEPCQNFVTSLFQNAHKGQSLQLIYSLLPVLSSSEVSSFIDQLLNELAETKSEDRRNDIAQFITALSSTAGGEAASMEMGGCDQVVRGERLSSGLLPSLSSVVSIVQSLQRSNWNPQVCSVLTVILKMLTANRLDISGEEQIPLKEKLQKTACSVLEYIQQYKSVSPSVVPPLLHGDILKDLALKVAHSQYQTIEGHDEMMTDVVSHCFQSNDVKQVELALLLSRCCRAAKEWILSTGLKHQAETGGLLNSTALLEVTLHFIKHILEDPVDQEEISTETYSSLYEILWGPCESAFLNSQSHQLAGEVIVLLLTHCKHAKLAKRAKALMKKMVKAEKEESFVWTKSHLAVLCVVVSLVVELRVTLVWTVANDLLQGLLREGHCREEVCQTCGVVLCHLKGVLSSQSSHLLQPDLVNVFIKETLRLHFCEPTFMSLLCHIVDIVYNCDSSDTEDGLTPGSVVLEMVWSHSRFLEVMLCNLELEPTELLHQIKEHLVHLLVSLVRLSECSIDKCAVLLAAYQATITRTDQGILYLLSHFEENGIKMADLSPFQWGKPALENYQSKKKVGWLLWKQPSTSEVLAVLKREQLFSSVASFPLHRQLQPVNPFSLEELKHTPEQEHSYDPSYLLPFLSHHLQPGCVVDCHKIVESGCLSFLIGSLSSYCDDVRLAAFHCLTLFKSHMEGARFRDKSQITLMMEVLQNSLTVENQRLLPVHAQLFSKLAQLLLKPENDLFPVLCEFLVYRPALDLTTLPFMNVLFYSSSPKAVSERVWMLKILVDGLRSEEDYKLYRRRDVFKSVMAFYESSLADQQTKGLVVQLLFRGISLPACVKDLVKRMSLFSWVHRLMKQGGTRQKDLLRLACDAWSNWCAAVRGDFEESNRLPYPYQCFQISFVLNEAMNVTTAT